MPNYSSLLNDPRSLCAGLVVKSAGQHFLSETQSLVQIAQAVPENGKERVRALLNVMIADLVAFFSVGKTMGAHQVIETAGFIWDDYKHLKPEDVKLCFDRIKKGFYGKIYDRIDGNLILDALASYDDDRTEQIELIRANQSSLAKKKLLLTTYEGSQEQGEALKALISDVAKRMRERKALEQKPIERVPNPINDMHQRWLRQFDELYRRNAPCVGKRFIKRYGKWLDITEYMQHKQWQYQQAMRRKSV